MTSKKDQEQYWIHKNEPYTYVSDKEFSEAFQSFHVGRKLGDELAVPFDKEKSHPAALTTAKYGVSKKEVLKACVSREFLLMKRNSFVYIFKMTQVRLLSLQFFPSIYVQYNKIKRVLYFMYAAYSHGFDIHDSISTN